MKRSDLELVAPAKPHPHKLKYLSDIDDQEGLRFHVPFICFYKNNPKMEGNGPVEFRKEGLGKALVYYYQFAAGIMEGYKKEACC